MQSEVDLYAVGSQSLTELSAAVPLKVSESFPMWFEYCVPKSGTPKAIFQTHHGLLGNAGYWNVNLEYVDHINPDSNTESHSGQLHNSFAESAATAGYATLSYDRLGTGRSADPDGTNVVQIMYESMQSIAIAASLRLGNLCDLGAWDTIIGIGHCQSISLGGNGTGETWKWFSSATPYKNYNSPAIPSGPPYCQYISCSGLSC